MSYQNDTRHDLERDLERCGKGLRVLKEAAEFAPAVRLAREAARLADTVPDKYAAWADQVYRAAVSVPANVSEAHGRGTVAQLIQYLRVARGSAYEVVGLIAAAPVEVPADLKRLAREAAATLDDAMRHAVEERLGRIG